MLLCCVLQDLVEELSKEKTWWTPNKLSQQAYDRNAEGGFAGFEEEVCMLLLALRKRYACHVAWPTEACWYTGLLLQRRKALSQSLKRDAVVLPCSKHRVCGVTVGVVFKGIACTYIHANIMTNIRGRSVCHMPNAYCHPYI